MCRGDGSLLWSWHIYTVWLVLSKPPSLSLNLKFLFHFSSTAINEVSPVAQKIALALFIFIGFLKAGIIYIVCHDPHLGVESSLDDQNKGKKTVQKYTLKKANNKKSTTKTCGTFLRSYVSKLLNNYPSLLCHFTNRATMLLSERTMTVVSCSSLFLFYFL